MILSGIQNRALRWYSGIDVALSGYPPKTRWYKPASCCHSRMILSGIQNRALRWYSGIDVALSGYPPKTCGYDKMDFGLAEVLGFRILHENS
jgi:hypothetical protein